MPEARYLPTEVEGVYLYYREGRERPYRFRVKDPSTGKTESKRFADRVLGMKWAKARRAEFVTQLDSAGSAPVAGIMVEYVKQCRMNGKSTDHIAFIERLGNDLVKAGLVDFKQPDAADIVRTFLLNRKDARHRRGDVREAPMTDEAKKREEVKAKNMADTLAALEKCGGHKGRAAEMLGIDESTVRQRLRNADRDTQQKFRLRMNHLEAQRREKAEQINELIRQNNGSVKLVAQMLGVNIGTIHRRRAIAGVAAEAQALKITTSKKILTHIKSLARFACQSGKLRFNPFEGVKIEGQYTPFREIFHLTECKTLVNAPAEIRQNPMWLAAMLYLYGGFRDLEGCFLRWCDIDFECGTVHVRVPTPVERAMGYRLKFNKERWPLILDELRGILIEAKPADAEPTDYVLPDCFREWSNGRRNRELEKLCKSVGIEVGMRTLHNLRHTNGAFLYACRAETMAILLHLGHEDTEVQRNYVKQGHTLRQLVRSWPAGQFQFMNQKAHVAPVVPAPTVTVATSPTLVFSQELDLPAPKKAEAKPVAVAAPTFSDELDWPDKERDELDIVLGDPDLVVIEEETAVLARS